MEDFGLIGARNEMPPPTVANGTSTRDTRATRRSPAAAPGSSRERISIGDRDKPRIPDPAEGVEEKASDPLLAHAIQARPQGIDLDERIAWYVGHLDDLRAIATNPSLTTKDRALGHAHFKAASNELAALQQKAVAVSRTEKRITALLADEGPSTTASRDERIAWLTDFMQKHHDIAHTGPFTDEQRLKLHGSFTTARRELEFYEAQVNREGAGQAADAKGKSTEPLPIPDDEFSPAALAFIERNANIPKDYQERRTHLDVLHADTTAYLLGEPHAADIQPLRQLLGHIEELQNAQTAAPSGSRDAYEPEVRELLDYRPLTELRTRSEQLAWIDARAKDIEAYRPQADESQQLPLEHRLHALRAMRRSISSTSSERSSPVAKPTPRAEPRIPVTETAGNFLSIDGYPKSGGIHERLDWLRLRIGEMKSYLAHEPAAQDVEPVKLGIKEFEALQRSERLISDSAREVEAERTAAQAAATTQKPSKSAPTAKTPARPSTNKVAGNIAAATVAAPRSSSLSEAAKNMLTLDGFPDKGPLNERIDWIETRRSEIASYLSADPVSPDKSRLLEGSDLLQKMSDAIIDGHFKNT